MKSINVRYLPFLLIAAFMALSVAGFYQMAKAQEGGGANPAEEPGTNYPITGTPQPTPTQPPWTTCEENTASRTQQVDDTNARMELWFLDEVIDPGECDAFTIYIPDSDSPSHTFYVKMTTDADLAFNSSCTQRNKTWGPLTGRGWYSRDFSIYGCSGGDETGLLTANLTQNQQVLITKDDTASVPGAPGPTPTATPQPTATRRPPPPPTPTRWPTSTPRPPDFRHELKVENDKGDLVDLGDVRWTVPSAQSLTYQVRMKNNSAIPDDYRFRVKLNTGETGFQLTRRFGIEANRERGCNWSNPKVDRQQTRWTSPGEGQTSHTMTFEVMRCSNIKTGQITLEFRKGDSGTIYTGDKKYDAPNFKRQKVDVVKYFIKHEFIKPHEKGRLSPVLEDPEVYEISAKRWNDAQAGVTLKRVTKGSRKIQIQGYWHHKTGLSNWWFQECPETAWACAIYPLNVIEEKLLIRQPPIVPDVNDVWKVRWTDSYREAKDRPNNTVYVSKVIAHEFGHTLGLGHTNSRDADGNISKDVMSQPSWLREMERCNLPNPNQDYLCGLSQYDIEALKALYP